MLTDKKKKKKKRDGLVGASEREDNRLMASQISDTIVGTA